MTHRALVNLHLHEGGRHHIIPAGTVVPSELVRFARKDRIELVGSARGQEPAPEPMPDPVPPYPSALVSVFFEDGMSGGTVAQVTEWVELGESPEDIAARARLAIEQEELRADGPRSTLLSKLEAAIEAVSTPDP